jgi:hypothetical protein
MDTANSEKLVFNLGDDPNHPRCSVTGRLFEVGSGALSHAEQSANFAREAALAADMPKPGERCAQTGREFEGGSGSLSKTAQTRQFLGELSPAQKAQRVEAYDALVAMIPEGRA